MRCLLTLSLALLALLTVAAPAVSAQVEPTDDGRYLITRGVVEDYVVCEAEARVLGAVVARQGDAIRQAEAVVSAAVAEAASLRLAVEACDRRARLTLARVDVAAAEAEAQRAAAQRERRGRQRWRAVAVVAGGSAAVLAALRLLSP